MLQHSLQLLRLFALPSIASYFLFISMLKVDSLHAGPCHLGVGGGGGGGGEFVCITQHPKKSKNRYAVRTCCMPQKHYRVQGNTAVRYLSFLFNKHDRSLTCFLVFLYAYFMWFPALIFIYSYKIQRAIRWQIEANSKLFSSVFPL
jgi:hypothetical protein